ncbi:MAG: hypothetical protein JWN86_3123 [Planctomycetota bacterium]|nr:hypothetical protein [Planctomycetota bacterium]
MTTIASESIDRIAPTLRPEERTAMRQRWAHLLFLHWPVPIESLRPLLPPELEVDTYHGTAYVGLVPFTMTGVRPTWAPPVWGLSNFHEVNVRTYVHFRGTDPGVWFFSLDAAQRIAVRIARTFWNLAYHDARMNLRRSPTGEIHYRSERFGSDATPAGCDLVYRPEGSPRAAEPGTLEHFLAERYVLYAKSKRGLLLGRVNHTPYPLQPARLLRCEETLLAANGLVRPDAEPLAHYASEVRVRVYPLRPVKV